MGTSDVFKALKIARAPGECNLRTLKTRARNARAFIQFFVNNILNKIIKESIFGTYFRANICKFLDLRARTRPV